MPDNTPKMPDMTLDSSKIVPSFCEHNIDISIYQCLSCICDPVSHPVHYNSGTATCSCGRRIECIDITRHMSFNLGNVLKYIWRADHKGKTIEDLKKAVWYLQDEIKTRESALE